MIAPADPVFLDLDDVLLIHEEQLARYGGGAGIRDAGLLAALVFLDLNGVVVPDREGRLYDAMIAIAERRMDKDGFAGLLRELAQDAPSTGDS